MMYTVHFSFDGAFMRFDTDKGPADFKDGFWLNEHMQYKPSEQVVYWIPGSALRYIEKTDIKERDKRK